MNRKSSPIVGGPQERSASNNGKSITQIIDLLTNISNRSLKLVKRINILQCMGFSK